MSAKTNFSVINPLQKAVNPSTTRKNIKALSAAPGAAPSVAPSVARSSTFTPVDPIPSSKNIKANLGSHIVASGSATEKRALAEELGTVSSTVLQPSLLALQTMAALSASKMVALTGTAAAAAAFPPPIAALFGTYMIAIFVLRQRGLNQELMANLYIIKTEIERMQRVYSVMNVIAKERGIDLNTASLTAVVMNLGKKIMAFAGPDTAAEIRDMEEFLSRGFSKENIQNKLNAIMTEIDTNAANAITSSTSGGANISSSTYKGGFLYAFLLNPDGSLRSPGEIQEEIIKEKSASVERFKSFKSRW
jgi:hypothetical protein